MTLATQYVLNAMAQALDIAPEDRTPVVEHGTESFASAFPVTDLAAGSIGSAAIAIAGLTRARFKETANVVVDRRLSSLWFAASIAPVGWSLPPAWDSIAGDYATQDGWIRLHTNAPKHKLAALAVLDVAENKEDVARAVAGWTAQALETTIVAANGCAAEMRSHQAWLDHPQGQAVAAEPLIAWSGEQRDIPNETTRSPRIWQPARARPLEGVRVLDLTRILAGPVATRFLAGYGADVLRIDPRDWDEPAVAPEVTLGKRCAKLDLRAADDRRIFEGLLRDADIIVHGYRADALENLGFGSAARQALNPALIDISLDAYGWTGPWAQRRGFDSLVQMSSGIAQQGMQWKGADRPTPLPVQALDHATGYFLAAAAVRGLQYRYEENRVMQARLSLARTAKLLFDMPAGAHASPNAVSTIVEREHDYPPQIEATHWGPAKRRQAPLSIRGMPCQWTHPAGPLGSAAPAW